MSRFYADIQGNRGPATRQGSAQSGIQSHTRGWGVGIRVDCSVNGDGEDECTVWLTSGSNGYGSGKLIGKYTKKDLNK